METKVCRKCGLHKDLSEFGRRTENPKWLRSHCRDCQNKASRELKNRPGAVLPANYEKICSVCKHSLPASCFSFRSTNLDKLNSSCKECNIRKCRIAYKKTVEKRQYKQLLNEIKQCKSCFKNLSVLNFWKKPDTKDGLTDSCINCIKEKRTKPTAKENHRKHAARTRKNHPDATKARLKVSMAIRSGLLRPPNELKCKYCSNQAQQYHHWSYKKEHWLDVEPICIPCHVKLTYSL